MMFFNKNSRKRNPAFLISFFVAFIFHGVALGLVLSHQKVEGPVLVSYISASMVVESLSADDHSSGLPVKTVVEQKPVPKKMADVSEKKEIKKPENTSQASSNPSNGTSQSKGEKTSASSGVPGGTKESGEKSLQKYIRRVVGLVNSKKSYPKESQNSKEQGLAIVKLTLDKSGKPVGVSLKSSTGFSKLDEASIRAVNSVGNFPSFPDEMMQSSLVIEIPLRYKL